MSVASENILSLTSQEVLGSKKNLEGFYTPQIQKTLKKNPELFISILSNNPTTYKTIADII
jgi:hypothetical protein